MNESPTDAGVARRSSTAWLPPRFFFFVFVTVHAGTSLWLLLRDFGAGMARLDSGLPASNVERIISVASTVLLTPLFIGAVRSGRIGSLFPGLLGWLPLFANSALWAICCWWCIAAVKRLRALTVASTNLDE
jgi:hypothetical protein